MGIGSTTLAKFIQFHQEGIFDNVSSVMEIGSQEIFCEGEEKSLENLFNTFGVQDIPYEEITRMSLRGSAREVYEKLGWKYNCVDVDGNFGALVIDLNFEDVPDSHRGMYDFVTNFGTTEHIANQLNCFKVMHDLTKPGGYMYHELICSGMLNYGLVNYNPKMFWMLCKSNFYDYVGMWFSADTKNPEKLPENIIQMSRDIDDNVLNNFATQSSMIGVLVRKVFDLPFVAPLDGDLSGTTPGQKSRYWTVAMPNAYDKISHLRYQIAPKFPSDINLNLDEQVNVTRNQLQALHHELEEARSEIIAMKTSKFWKLRSEWFKLKKLVGINE